MNESNFKVNLSDFEGPIDLLLYLVKKNKFDIKNIEISRIVDQYLFYIKNSNIANLSEQGYYLYMAALLINLKVKKLYKDSTHTKDDEEDFTEEQLKDMMLTFSYIKQSVEDFFSKEPRLFWDNFISGQAQEKISDLPTQEIVQLMNAIQRILVRAKKPFNEKVLERGSIDIKRRITILIDILKNSERKWFFELMSEKLNTIEIVETFLSVLELLKRGAVKVIQNDPNDDILIIPTKKIHRCKGILNPVL